MECSHCHERTHWSHMNCNDTSPHPSHVWNASYLRFGPYLCGGIGRHQKASSS